MSRGAVPYRYVYGASQTHHLQAGGAAWQWFGNLRLGLANLRSFKVPIQGVLHIVEVTCPSCTSLSPGHVSNCSPVMF